MTSEFPYTCYNIHMNIILRSLQRLIIGIIVLLTTWFIVTQVWTRLDEQLPVFLVIIITYILSAYFILPHIIHVTIFALREERIPRFARAADGLLADPVHIILIGSKNDLDFAFRSSGWYEADLFIPTTAFKMADAFLRNISYQRAPFSPLFLFGRKQDIGFEQAISEDGSVSDSASPRRRHHVRFWAVNIHPEHLEKWKQNPEQIEREKEFKDFKFWKSKQVVDYSKPVMWVGAGTKDTGFGFSRLTYQISHSIDDNVDEERNYILETLERSNLLIEKEKYDSGTFKIGKYMSDGKIVVATLKGRV